MQKNVPDVDSRLGMWGKVFDFFFFFWDLGILNKQEKYIKEIPPAANTSNAIAIFTQAMNVKKLAESQEEAYQNV